MSTPSSSFHYAGGRRPGVGPFIKNQSALRTSFNRADIIRVQNDLMRNYDDFGGDEDAVVPLRRYSRRSKYASENQFSLDERNSLGPIRKRRCTDLCCLFLFIIFLSGWAGLLSYFLRYVQIEQVIYPTDSYGSICGQGELSDRPYLYFFNILRCAADLEGTIIDGCKTPQVCVSHCPNKTFSIRETADFRDIELKYAICEYHVKPNRYNLYELTKKEKCAKFYLASEPVGGRCIPTILHVLNKEIQDEIRKNETISNKDNSPISTKDIVSSNLTLAKLIQALNILVQISIDVAHTWRWILIGLIMTMLIAYIWISLMQFIARYMIWLAIIALMILNILALYASANQYLIRLQTANETSTTPTEREMERELADMVELHNEDAFRHIRTVGDSDVLVLDFKGLLQDTMEPYLSSPKVWMFITILLAVVFLVGVLLLCCLCQRIRLAVAVIEEGSKAVHKVKSTLWFPIVPFALKLAIFSAALVSFTIIATGSQPRYRNPVTGTFCNPSRLIDQNNCTRERLFNVSFVYFSHGLNLFAIIWLLFFISGLCYMTLAGTFAEYYWTLNKRHVPFFVLLGSFGRCIRYHLGSVALGSLVITIVRFIRFILEFIDNKCKKYPNNVVSQFIMGCCKCCLWCLEKFIKFINKNAYIMVAVHGKPFCQSAQDAFGLIVKNGMRALVLSCLSGFLLFLSKLAVTGTAGAIAFYFVNDQSVKIYLEDFHRVHYLWAPLGVFVFLSYILASTIFNVYNVAIDTIFLSYLEDCEKNDGSPERPYYMTKSLSKMPKARPRKSSSSSESSTRTTTTIASLLSSSSSLAMAKTAPIYWSPETK